MRCNVVFTKEKKKKHLTALSHFNKTWNLKHGDIILLILVAEASGR